jgi:hypothetical protein
MPRFWSIPELLGVFGGGGDKGELGERSAHPKPPRNLRLSGTAKFGSSLVTRNQYLKVESMMKETLQSFVKDEWNDMQKLERTKDEKELLEEELTNVAAQPKSDPTNLMGSPSEAHQAQ